MATFSPSPAPRRSTRLQTRATSPAARLPRRLAPAPTYHSISDAASVVSAMDVDERNSIMTDRSLSRIGGDVLFAKTNEMSVLFYATLPLEVKQVLRISGALVLLRTYFVFNNILTYLQISKKILTQERLIPSLGSLLSLQ